MSFKDQLPTRRPKGEKTRGKKRTERRLLVSITELSLLRDDRAVSQPFPGNQSPVRSPGSRQEEISLAAGGRGVLREVSCWKYSFRRSIKHPSRELESIHHHGST